MNSSFHANATKCSDATINSDILFCTWKKWDSTCSVCFHLYSFMHCVFNFVCSTSTHCCTPSFLCNGKIICCLLWKNLHIDSYRVGRRIYRCDNKNKRLFWFLTLLVLIFSNDSPLESLDTSPGFQSQGWKSGTEEVSKMWSSSGSSRQSIIRDSNRKIRGPQNFIFNILVRNEERKLW